MQNRFLIVIIVIIGIGFVGSLLSNYNTLSKFNDLNNQVTKLQIEDKNNKQLISNYQNEITQLKNEEEKRGNQYIIGQSEEVQNKRNTNLLKSENDKRDPNLLRITYPIGGETFCIDDGGTTLITWETPGDMEYVEIVLVTPRTAGMVGSFRAMQEKENGIGKGNYRWNFRSEKNGYAFEEDELYKLTIRSVYNGKYIENSMKDFFALRKCNK